MLLNILFTVAVEGYAATSDSLTLDFNPINMGNMMIRPAYILADGETQSTITVRLSEKNGQAILSGEPVDFSTTCGSLLANEATTDASGNRPGCIAVTL